MLSERKITVELTAGAKALLAEKGYDPAYGARPLKRVIQQELQNPLAVMLLEGKIHDDQKVTVTAGKKGLVIEG